MKRWAVAALVIALVLVMVVLQCGPFNEGRRNWNPVEYGTSVDGLACHISIASADAGCTWLDEWCDGGWCEDPVRRFASCGERFITCGVAAICFCPWDGTRVVPWRTGWRPWTNWP